MLVPHDHSAGQRVREGNLSQGEDRAEEGINIVAEEGQKGVREREDQGSGELVVIAPETGNNRWQLLRDVIVSFTTAGTARGVSGHHWYLCYQRSTDKLTNKQLACQSHVSADLLGTVLNLMSSSPFDPFFTTTSTTSHGRMTLNQATIRDHRTRKRAKQGRLDRLQEVRGTLPTLF
jgi:hypothetical protein